MKKETDNKFTLQNFELLVVEDDEGLNRIICKNLERSGFKVSGFLDGKTALNYLKKNTPDIMLVDYKLPDMTAEKFISKIENKKEIPFLIMTGFADISMAVEMMKLGARDYLVKDNNFLDFLPAEIKHLLEEIYTQKKLIQTEKALLISEMRYRNIFEVAPIAIWEQDISDVYTLIAKYKKNGVTDFKNHIKDNPDFVLELLEASKPVDINNETLYLLKAKNSDEIMEHLKIYAKEKVFDVIKNILLAIIEGEPYFEAESIIKNIADEYIYVAIKAKIPEAKDAYKRIILTMMDITERVKIETALRTSEERLNLALEATNDGLWDFNPKTQEFYMSPKCNLLLGYPPDYFSDFIQIWGEIVHPEDAKNALLQISEELKDKQPTFSCEIRMKTASGNWNWMFIRGQVVEWNENGEVTRIVGTASDITQRKKAEEALKISEFRFREIFEKSNDAICVVQGLKIILLNPHFEMLFGYPKETVLSDEFEFIKVLPEEDRMLTMNLLEGFRKSGSVPNQVQFKAYNKNKELIECSASLSVIHWGTSRAVLCIIRDMSEQYKLEAQLRQAQKMESIGRLAGGVAHDFNNLLTAIIGNAELAMISLNENDPIYRDLEEIVATSSRAANLTRQLLTFSRRQILSPKVIDLNSIIKDMERMLKRIIGENIRLETHTKSDLCKIKADPSQIEQVIVNLAVNARDAMSEGGKLTIETRDITVDNNFIQNQISIPNMEKGKYALISISDTGIGMEDNIKAHIFEPFFTTKPVGKGTGLGLATVYGIVHQSGGYIWMNSEINKGTVFNIFLPAVKDKKLKQYKQPNVPINLVGDETILVVEDEEAVRKMAVRSLERYGYKVLSTGSSKTALEICKNPEQKIDIVLTDVVMPEINGVELAKQVKTILPDTKFVFMSGYTEETILQSKMINKDNPYIQKPFKPVNLVEKIRETLNNKNV
jgi:PAS domain S-box-containing protein